MTLTKQMRRLVSQLLEAGGEMDIETGPMKVYQVGTLRGLERRGIVTVKYTPIPNVYEVKLCN